MKGFGVSLGGSLAIPNKEIIGAIGADFNILGDPNKQIKYVEETVSIGIASSPGAEGHVQMSYTWNSKPFNIFNVWDKLYEKYYEHEKVNPCCGVQ